MPAAITALRPFLAMITTLLIALAMALASTPTARADGSRDDPATVMAQSTAQQAYRAQTEANMSHAAPDIGKTSFLSTRMNELVVSPSASNFSAGDLISDNNFFNGSAMTASSVQDFLNQEMPDCRSGFTCLNTYSANSTDQPGDAMCNAYPGALSETAATIIAKVGVACGISQKVLITLLQKEQGLVTDTYPSSVQYDNATGYACPDTGNGCDPNYVGFFNQVYGAAWQFKRYGNPAGSSGGIFNRYPVGEASNIAYSPDDSCGSSSVTIWNAATAALYYYTPYQPNAAALADIFGKGDACSSYGNRNFWTLYTDWFGSTTSGQTPAVTRLFGDDRYATAVKIAQSAYPSGDVPVVYIATGENFPDALSAAPAAAKQGGPLLLVQSFGIPGAVLSELDVLRPQRIVVVGGEVAVNGSVYAQLSSIQPNITRLAGTDRFDTSAQIALFAFGTASNAYVATGDNFPDALSAGAAGGSQDAPVVLVNGWSDTVNPATISLLAKLGTSELTIVGGPQAVSLGIEGGLGRVVGTVNRIAGADRFATSSAVNRAAFSAARTVYLATGMTFPDALAGAAVAGGSHNPLYVVPSLCVPADVASDVLLRYEATQVMLIGGASALTGDVSKLTACQ